MILERIENGPFFVNSFIVACPDTHRAILVDPGHETDRIGARVSELGLEVTAIVNTHAHLDHIAGARHFQNELLIPFKLHRDDAFLLESVERSCAAFGLPPFEPPRVDEWLEPGTTVPVGDLSFGLRAAPGHSPGSLIFDFGDQMIVGDVVFRGSIGRTDLPGGDMATLLDSISREVLSKADDVVLHPGHGPATTVGHERRTNPFLVSLGS